MRLSEFKTALQSVQAIQFELPDGTPVPPHYHVTEIGNIQKDFIDCGGKIRQETTISLQLWVANDTDHRLTPEKLLQIIAMSEEKVGVGNHEIEVEYQSDTIGKYGLDFNGQHFVLTSKSTDCLAKGICLPKPKINLSNLMASSGKCTPGGGCC